MKAEIISVGTELLTGQIVNTNAQFLSEQLAALGVDNYFQTTVGDNEERLIETLRIARKRSDLILLTGGLGPTDDDLTKQTLAQFLNRKLIIDEESKRQMDAFFASRPDRPYTKNNLRQAQIIEDSIALPNDNGLAVGGIVEVDDVIYIVLPGPPNELKPMVKKHLIPHIAGLGQKLYSRILRFFGIGESQLVTLIADLIRSQTDPTIAPYAKTGEVTLRLSTKAETFSQAKEKLDALERQILSRGNLADLLYGYGDSNSLVKVVFNQLKKRNQTLSAAESLTGGLFQATMTDLAKSSSVFVGGYVTYGIEQKVNLLGISRSELEENGVVSSFAAKEMALKTREILGTDFSVSMTGVAGPDEIEGKAVGTVFIGLASKDGVLTKSLSLGNRSRQAIRTIVVLNVLDLIRRTLLNEESLVQ